MSQQWVPTSAGSRLAGRKKTDTAPEVLLRKALHAQGARFRLHVRLARGCTPDILMPRRRLAVFVDGCFWHSCPLHGRKTRFTGPNAALWTEKMARNRRNDERSTALAVGLGWTVRRVWECEIREDPQAAARRLLAAVG